MNEKTGLSIAVIAQCNVTGRTVPVWVVVYVLCGCGNRAVMAVPVHDARDIEFATAYRLPIPRVIEGGEESAPVKDLWSIGRWKVAST